MIFRKHILWVSDTPPLDIFLHKSSLMNVVEQFARMGYKVTLIATRSRNFVQHRPSKVHMISIPSRYIPMISRPLFAVVLFFLLPFYIVLAKPDYIITQPDVTILSFFSALPFSRLRGTKLVLDIRSTPVETVGFSGYLQLFFFATSVLIAKKLFNGMTVITPSMKREICGRYAVNVEKVGTWSSGVSTALFDPERCNLRNYDLKKKLGLTRKFVVLYHGVFSEHRGLIETVEAMSIVKRTNSDIIFMLLGKGYIYSRLVDLIKIRKLQDTIIIHNSVEYTEVPEYIAMCNVGIVPLPDHPYWRFQSPLKLIEYLAMEKVVIVTDIPAHRAIIGKNECGIYSLSNKPAEIARVIQYAYHNREKLDEWGRIGRAIAKREYAWEKVAKSLEEYLLSIN